MQFVAQRKWHITTIVLTIVAFYYSIAGRNYISRAVLMRARANSDIVSGKIAEMAPDLKQETDRLVRRSGLFQMIGARLCLVTIVTFFLALWRREPTDWLHECTMIGLVMLTLIQFVIV